jgi:hypothetical protein
MRDYITNYVKGCESCQCTKPRKGPPPGQLTLLPMPTGPWKEMMWDLIGPLPELSGYNAIVVCIDPYSKEGKFSATTMSISRLGAMRIMRDRVVRDWGLPEKVYSDRRPQFVSSVMRVQSTIGD